MCTTLKTRAALDVASIPTPVKLAAAWTSFMFLYVYVDVLNFYKPHVVAGILDGMVWQFEVNPPLLTGMLASVMVPAVMIVLSVTLPPRANRIVNVVVASLYVPYSAFNIAGSTAEWLPFYVLSIGAELALLVFIVQRAWTSVSRREALVLRTDR
ncbi:DUF6326 family protein [Microbacterium hominis]|uniref:DUF6326 family protein n=1 Tax=Microbacterium hominis TaxID=162426 RepID=UPI000768861D|nr:DUF6326 family protein [Microbacterium hominis]KXC04466.1 hypothetical protein MhomT_16260 [Microbacterium hominis]